MLTDTDLKNITYVVVEVANKKTKQVLIGYFKGFVSLNESTIYSIELKDEYIVLKNDDNIFVLRVDDFSISTISVGITIGKASISKRSFSLAHNASVELLKQIQEYFVNTNNVDEAGLIDTSQFNVDVSNYLAFAFKKYNKLEYVLTEEKENTKGITASSNNKQNTSETVEVKTTILKRTKYDKNKVIKKLADLADKVNKLRADQYVVVLPTEKEDKSKSETAANPNEDQLPPGCYGEDFHPEFFCC